MVSLDQYKDVLDLHNSSLQLPVLDPYIEELHINGCQLLLFPTFHDEMAFSQFASQILDEYQIDEVLLELPIELEGVMQQAIDRLPIPTVIHDGQLQTKGGKTLTPAPEHAYIVHPGESMYWTAYLSHRAGIPVHFIDQWHPDAYQTWQILLGYEHLAAVGWNTFWEEGTALAQAHLDQDIHRYRSQQMATRLSERLTSGQTILVVIGAAHWPALLAQLRKQGGDISSSMVPSTVVNRYAEIIEQQQEPEPVTLPEWLLADIHPHTFHLVTGQLPYYLGQLVENPLEFDQLESIRQLYFEAERIYKTKFDDQVSPSSYQRLFQYLRNLGRIQGKILPDLYNLVAGGKGMVDDDYAFEVYRTAISYPFFPDDQQSLDDQLKFVPDEKQGEVIKFAFKRRFKRPILKKVDHDEFDDLDPIPDEDYPGQWEEIWNKHAPYGYVSYPPEDKFIENYMQYLRKRIIEILMEEESSTMEFKTSLEDGIDWRETMRHYHEGKIYVKKYPKNKYKVGALIVQFLEEPFDTSEYSNHSTLFAEHDQESHISVITTEPGDVLVGPGITRVKYAAIVSQFPPVGMPYLIGRENVDLKLRLIWTAMNMSLNKIIGFVAKKPPTSAQRHFAAEQGYRLVYLPMGQLTSDSLRRLRTMHLLAHRGLRDNAREYIGF